MSMFDDDEDFVDDLDGQEPTDEDIMLAQLGIEPRYADLFLKHNKGKKIFHPKISPENMTKQFFEYYLGNCDEGMISRIVKDKLAASLQELIDTTEPVRMFTEKGDNKVKAYIEKNAVLIKEISDLKAQLNDANVKAERSYEFAAHLLFMYDFMSDKCEVTGEVSDEELEILQNVKNAIDEAKK